jgi:hypothetical protein
MKSDWVRSSLCVQLCCIGRVWWVGFVLCVVRESEGSALVGDLDTR